MLILLLSSGLLTACLGAAATWLGGGGALMMALAYVGAGVCGMLLPLAACLLRDARRPAIAAPLAAAVPAGQSRHGG